MLKNYQVYKYNYTSKIVYNLYIISKNITKLVLKFS